MGLHPLHPLHPLHLHGVSRDNALTVRVVGVKRWGEEDERGEEGEGRYGPFSSPLGGVIAHSERPVLACRPTASTL